MYKHFLLKSIKWSYICRFSEFHGEKGENVFNSLIKYLEYISCSLCFYVFFMFNVCLIQLARIYFRLFDCYLAHFKLNESKHIIYLLYPYSCSAWQTTSVIYWLLSRNSVLRLILDQVWKALFGFFINIHRCNRILFAFTGFFCS